MNQLMRFPSAVQRAADIDAWMREHDDELGAIAQHWFEVIRACGHDVRELLHDGHPTACVGDAAFAYAGSLSGIIRHKIMKPRITIVTLGVRDLPRAIRFYRDGLGFPTEAKDDASIGIFMTQGVRLALYPKKALAEDISTDIKLSTAGFGGITLAHNVEKKEEAAEVLRLAEKAGGKIVKPAQDVFWGGHSGYFADLDCYYWEVAWAPMCSFDETGALVFK